VDGWAGWWRNVLYGAKQFQGLLQQTKNYFYSFTANNEIERKLEECALNFFNLKGCGYLHNNPKYLHFNEQGIYISGNN
jgi:hypothetical protein